MKIGSLCVHPLNLLAAELNYVGYQSAILSQNFNYNRKLLLPKVTVTCLKEQEKTVYVATIHAAVPHFKAISSFQFCQE